MANIINVSKIHRFFRCPELIFVSSGTTLEFRVQRTTIAEPLIFERILYWKEHGFFSVFPWRSGKLTGSNAIGSHHELYETLVECVVDYRLEN